MAVITPYAAEKSLVLSKLRAVGGLAAQVKADTVGGREATFVINIVDFTGPILRAEDPSKVGFTGDPKRLNVALTRAKVAMVIVGDWARWVDHLPALLNAQADERQMATEQSSPAAPSQHTSGVPVL